MRVNELVRFIVERERIRVKKEAGKPRPWTEDPILSHYRFCNVHREDDRVTRWLREHWYPYLVGNGRTQDPNPDIWFTAVVARLLNNPEALEAVRETIVPWKPEKFRQILHRRKAFGLKNFNAAYIVSTNGVQMDKVDYLVSMVLGLLWADRKQMRPKDGDSLDVYHKMLMTYDGLGSFMAAQVVADLKYMFPLNQATDWLTFAASGPGSRRGLNRVMDRAVDMPWKEVTWHSTLLTLQERVNLKLLKGLFPYPLHAQDIQNCLCEFDKYERARLGQGEPKQIYRINQEEK